MSSPRPVEEATKHCFGRVTVVLPWDLDPSLAALPKTPAEGQLLVLETRAKVHALPWHRQKLTLLVSALRHFVEELSAPICSACASRSRRCVTPATRTTSRG